MADLRRSARIEELTARKAAEEDQRVAKLETGVKAAGPPRKSSATPKGKKPSQTRKSPQPNPSAKTPAGAKRQGDQSTESENPRKRRKTAPSNRDEEVAGFQTTFADEHEQDATPSDTAEPAVEEAFKLLQILINMIGTLRMLRQKRKARAKCLTEQSQLDTLMDYHRPAFLNVPQKNTGEQAARGELKADIARFERNIAQRLEQEEDLDREISSLMDMLGDLERQLDDCMIAEMPPGDLPPSMKDDVDFRESYKYCRSLSRTVKDVERRLRGVEQERKTILDRHYSHAEPHRKSGPADPRVKLKDVYMPEQDLQDSSRLYSQQQELELDAQKARKMCSVQMKVIAGLAERDLVERGILEAYVSDDEQSVADPEDGEEIEQAPVETSNAQKLKTQHDALQNELLSAQHDLCDGYKEFKDGRKLTEEEFAQIPEPVTEDRIGEHLYLKLRRTTRKLIEAEARVAAAQAEGRRLGHPEVDRYPYDQTWDFEDRSDDGYAVSAIADKMEKSRPKVERWLPQLAMSGKPLSPSRRLEPPESLPDLEALRLGDDKGDDFSSVGLKERIVKYQRTCDELRRSGQFPRAARDPVVSDEQSLHLNSHMV